MTRCSPSPGCCPWRWLQVGRRWAAWEGGADTETDATPLEGNPLCCCRGCVAELAGEAGGSSVAAGTGGVGTC